MRFSVQNLACQRADQLIFEGLSFALGPGEAIWVQGRNGAGKSSLLRICAGLLRPHAGGVAWADEDIFTESDRYQGAFHYVGHQDALKPAFTVRENIEFWAAYHGHSDIETALAEFELAPLRDTPTGILSQGQKKRTNLARLAASSAPLWILDEPVSALDKHFIALFKEKLLRHLAGGGMAIFATHQDLGIDQVRRLNLDEVAV